MMALRILGAIIFLSLSTTQAYAGIFSDDQQVADIKAVQSSLNKQVQDLLDRVGRIEASNQNLPDMVSQFENMTQTLAEMKGKLDELNNRLDQMTKRNQELYLDLDSRLKVLEGTNPQGASATQDKTVKAPLLPQTAQANSKDVGQEAKVANKNEPASAPLKKENQADNKKDTNASEPAIKEAPAKKGPSYDSGLNAFNTGKYDQSVKIFKAFILANPDDEKVPNALFWIGLNDLVLKDYKEAVTVNKRVIKDYPESSKVPDAMLNLARAYRALGDVNKAKAVEHHLESKYPDSDAAVKLKKHHNN